MFGFAPVFSIHSFSSSILSYACQSFFFFSSAFPPHLVSYCRFGISPFFCPPNPFLNLLIRPHTLFCLPSFFFFFLWLYFQPSTPFFDLQSFFQSYFFLNLFFFVFSCSLFCSAAPFWPSTPLSASTSSQTVFLRPFNEIVLFQAFFHAIFSPTIANTQYLQYLCN